MTHSFLVLLCAIFFGIWQGIHGNRTLQGVFAGLFMLALLFLWKGL